MDHTSFPEVTWDWLQLPFDPEWIRRYLEDEQIITEVFEVQDVFNSMVKFAQEMTDMYRMKMKRLLSWGAGEKKKKQKTKQVISSVMFSKETATKIADTAEGLAYKTQGYPKLI